jgi:DnaJ family protein A protein 2
MSDPYTVLGIDRKASADEVRKAYKRRSLETHPDRGGTKEEFQAVNEANAILSDQNKRAVYDATGSTEEHRGPDLSQMFGSMFGAGFPFPMSGGGPGPMKVNRGRNVHHEIGVSLRELWHGKTFTFNMKRGILCTDCSGRGGTKLTTCSDCGGRGISVRRQQMGPMMMMTQEACTTCRQTGQKVTETCKGCTGRCVIERETSLEAHIEPGMQEGDRLIFPGKCSESPEYESPGDVILIIRAAATDPDTWIRRGPDLILEVTLTVAESLLGWERTIADHPSNRPLHLSWTGGMVREGEILRVPGWGMPVKGRVGEFGDLRIACHVSVQGAWSEEQLHALKGVWPEWRIPTSTEQTVKAERS